MNEPIDPISQELETDFPNLARVGYQVRSSKSEDYNCVAWAAGVNDGWWEPGRYWPGILGTGIDALKSVVLGMGYRECADGELEPGFEKVVLYCDKAGYWQHVAKQLSDGWWTSKMGPDEDLVHRTPYALLNRNYQFVCCYMKREIQGAGDDTAKIGDGPEPGSTAEG